MDIASGTQYVKESDMKWDLALKSGAIQEVITDTFLPPSSSNYTFDIANLRHIH